MCHRRFIPQEWYGNAESFYKIGKAAGEDMLKLLR